MMRVRRSGQVVHSAQSVVSRYGTLLAMLALGAMCTVMVASVVQTRAAREARSDRTRTAAQDAAAFMGEYLSRRHADQSTFLAANRDLVTIGTGVQLQQDVAQRYLAVAPQDVIGVIVTDPQGQVVVSLERVGNLLDQPRTVEELQRIADLAFKRESGVISNRLGSDDRVLYGDASPLSGITAELGAWVTVYDLAASPVAPFIRRDAVGDRADVQLYDANERLLLGAQRNTGSDDSGSVELRRAVPGTDWHVLVSSASSTAGLSGWLYALFAAGVFTLGGLYLLRDRTGRKLARRTSVMERQTQRLYALASDLLHSETPQEQASLLAAALRSATGVDMVRVRVAAERAPEGVVAGSLAHPQRARMYRLAITGAGAPTGEVVLYTDTNPVPEQVRAMTRAMTAMAGAAMHTITVLERERHAAEELQRIDELRTNLLSTVAHELRSPLTAVKGVLSLLSMQEDLPAKSREYVDVATERTDALVALIRDLFDCSLLESGQLMVRPERCSASEILERALGAVAAANPGQVLLSATPNLMITVDPLRFDQIVNNMVTNAFRHGAPPVEVAIRPYRDGACIVITDNGRGIEREERARIFAKFYQSDSGHSRLVEGAGLGLALVHGLVTLHGGRIEVDSVRMDGRGARFTILLPDVAPEQSARPAHEDAVVSIAAPSSLDLDDEGTAGTSVRRIS